MSNYFRGEMAPLDQKITGGSDHPSAKVSPYQLVISYDGSGEFHTRLTFQRKDYFFER